MVCGKSFAAVLPGGLERCCRSCYRSRLKWMGLPIGGRALNITLCPMCPLAQGHVAVMHRQPLRLGSAADLHLQFAGSARCFWRMKKNFFDSDDV